MSILHTGICRTTGYPVEERRHDGGPVWGGRRYWFAYPFPGASPLQGASGPTKQAAVEAMLAKQHMSIAA